MLFRVVVGLVALILLAAIIAVADHLLTRWGKKQAVKKAEEKRSMDMAALPPMRVSEPLRSTLYAEDVPAILAKLWLRICDTIEPALRAGNIPNDIVVNWYHPSYADYEALRRVIKKEDQIDFGEHGFALAMSRVRALVFMANDFREAAKFVAEGNTDPEAISIVIFCEVPGTRDGEIVPRATIFDGKRLPPHLIGLGKQAATS